MLRNLERLGAVVLLAAATGCPYVPPVQPTPCPTCPELRPQVPEGVRTKRAEVRRTNPGEPTVELEIVAEFTGLPSATREVPLQLDGSTLWLRDDGNAPDTLRGDGRFTATLEADEGELVRFTQRLIDPQLRRAASFDVGRAKLPFDRTQVDFGSLLDGKVVKLFPLPVVGDPDNVDIGRSLMITDLSVIEDPTRTFDPCGPDQQAVGDPDGKWSFGHLMTALANQSETGVTGSELARRWLRHWEVPQTVNFDAVPARANIASQLLDDWVAESGGPGAPLDLDKAPFRLLSIVNRIDLGGVSGYGSGSAGEGRFVFGALDKECRPLQFTVIFEYGVPVSGCGSVKSWAQAWMDLDSHAIGSPAYLAALELITDRFAEAGADPTKLPNKSALNQLRSNEIALSAPWELREWALASSGADAGHLRMVTTKQTPDHDLDRTSAIDDYLADHEPELLAGTDVVPLSFPASSPFLSGASPTPFGQTWRGVAPFPSPKIAPTNTSRARHLLSLNTCSGCHAGDTSTVFTHVKPREHGSEAALSGFLTGITVPDPMDTTTHDFDDLLRRATELDALVHTPCLFMPFRSITQMVH